MDAKDVAQYALLAQSRWCPDCEQVTLSTCVPCAKKILAQREQAVREVCAKELDLIHEAANDKSLSDASVRVIALGMQNMITEDLEALEWAHKKAATIRGMK